GRLRPVRRSRGRRPSCRRPRSRRSAAAPALPARAGCETAGMTVELRPASLADTPALAAVHAQSFPAAWSQDEIATLLKGPGAFGLVAHEGGEPAAGFILGRAIEGEAEILTIAVSPRLRRQGVGLALVESAVGLAGAAGSAALFLEVATDNEAGLGLYT